MDVVERLTLEAAQADTMLACEHRHRYELASTLTAGLSVLDLCCGSGYGSAILARHAREIVGVDNDAATVDTARVTVGPEAPNVSFELADAVGYLRGDLQARFEAIVCFEGLEHLAKLEEALELLRGHAEQGVRLVLSVPNDQLFAEPNPFHVTTFGYDEAMRAMARFSGAVMLPQFLAEGSLICPEGASETEVTVSLEGRDEPQYANHFLFCVGFDPDAVQRAHHGRIQVSTSPIFNRWSEDLKRGAWALRRENARLARARLGKAGSAAASVLASHVEREARIAELEDRCRLAERRVRELEAALGGGGEEIAVTGGARPSGGETGTSGVTGAGATQAPSSGGIPVAPPPPGRDPERSIDPHDHPNSWENRRRRAAYYLIPWIEQTVSLAGKTVLEYGCGNGPVSCAFAQHGARVIGVDIDGPAVELGREALRERGVSHVELEIHPLEEIADAVRTRRGQVDVFLLYAVLEHLTVAERLDVLRLAREVVKPDGAIVVCETPNRLTYFDHHTAQIPFFHLLPDELALGYYERSGRDDFRASIDAAAAKGPEAAGEAIVRWGRGVSFHEFEIVFGDLTRHVIGSSYDPLLFPERPVHPEEVVLARYLERARPDLAPAFSRSWLDLILSPTPVAKRPAFIRPWCASTIESRNVGWTPWENLYLTGPDATLSVTFPHPTARIVVGSVSAEPAQREIRLRADGTGVMLAASARHLPVDEATFLTFELPGPTQSIRLSSSHSCTVVFVGYED